MGLCRWIVWLLLVGPLSTPARAQEEGELERGQDGFIERIDRIVEVAQGGTLYLTAEYGRVEVKTWERDQVRVEVEKRVRELSESRARKTLANFQVYVEQNGKDVEVQAEPENGRRPRNLQIDIILTAPGKYHVHAETGSGSIEVVDLEGDFVGRTFDGSIRVGRVRNGDVQVESSGGRIAIERIENGSATAETSGGSITVDQVTGDLEAGTSGGSIRIETVGGAVNAQTAGGNISIEEAGGSVRAETAGGSISIASCRGDIKADNAGGSIDIGSCQGSIEAETAGGSISIEGAGGHIEASTAGGIIEIAAAQGYIEASTAGGSIEAELATTDQEADRHCMLESSGGDITIYLPEELAATIDAELRVRRVFGGTYRIYSDFPLSIRGADSRKITGSGEINGGGDLIKLRTSNGDIRINRVGR